MRKGLVVKLSAKPQVQAPCTQCTWKVLGLVLHAYNPSYLGS